MRSTLKPGDKVKVALSGSFFRGRVELIRRDGKVWIRFDSGHPALVDRKKVAENKGQFFTGYFQGSRLRRLGSLTRKRPPLSGQNNDAVTYPETTMLFNSGIIVVTPN